MDFIDVFEVQHGHHLLSHRIHHLLDLGEELLGVLQLRGGLRSGLRLGAVQDREMCRQVFKSVRCVASSVGSDIFVIV